MPKFVTQNALFGYFWAKIKKTIVIFEISTLEFVKYEFLTHTPLFLNARVRVRFIKYAICWN